MTKFLKLIVAVALSLWGLFGSWQCIQESKARNVRDEARRILSERKRAAARARWETLGVVRSNEILGGVSELDTIEIQRRVRSDLPVLLCNGMIRSSYLDSKTGRPTYRIQDPNYGSSFRVIWEISSDVDLITGPGAGDPFAIIEGCLILHVKGIPTAAAKDSEFGDIVVPCSTDGRKYAEMEPPVDI